MPQHDIITSESGTKHDEGKPMWHLLPLIVVNEIVKVLTFGAKKYGENDWQKFVMTTDGHRRYFSAALRHLTAYQSGEMDDKETGKPHVVHAICCLIFIVWSGRHFNDKEIQF